MSTRRLADILSRQGHQVGADTVADLLREEGFSLQGNSRVLEGASHPDRDGQFRYINEQIKEYQASDDPVVSVDAKKKEQVGDHHMSGREWQRKGEPVQVRSHDFPRLGEPSEVIPYGVYDPAANTGWVSVGCDHNTAGFAVSSIRRWWQAVGQQIYPSARRLLITADAGGSNGYRTRAWKAELAALAVESGLEITVCHFPPGTSKWNQIEHRLFSHITMNWRGRPLTSHEVVINTIAATTTRTGLTVRAELDTRDYPLGTHISDAQLQALPLEPHDWHGNWNYTLLPQTFTQVAAQPSKPFSQPSECAAWLCHPSVTGLDHTEWEALIRALGALHDDQREALMRQRRGRDRKHPKATNTGRHPKLTLVDRLLAVILRDRFALPRKEIAGLFTVSIDIVDIRIKEVRKLLNLLGRAPEPSKDQPATLAELRRYIENVQTISSGEIKQAS